MSVQHTIEGLAKSRVKDDPKLIASLKRLEELRRKPSQIDADIQKLEADLIEKEKQIAREVLNGGAAAVAGLSKLREKIGDLKEERRIFNSVIEQAATAHEQLKSELEAEREQKCRQAFREALADVLELFESGHEKFELLKQAVRLSGSFHMTDEIHDLERIIRRWSELSARAEARS